MPEKTTKPIPEQKLVEDSVELVECELLSASSEQQSTAQTSPTDVFDPATAEPEKSQETQLSTQVSTATAVATVQPKTPMTVLKNTILKALPFVLISIVVFSIPFLASPGTSWLNYPQVRTYMLCALIWNLIGAVLYAQVDKRLSRLMIVLIFAIPLITSHLWATWIYLIEMALRSIFSIPP